MASSSAGSGSLSATQTKHSGRPTQAPISSTAMSAIRLPSWYATQLMIMPAAYPPIPRP